MMTLDRILDRIERFTDKAVDRVEIDVRRLATQPTIRLTRVLGAIASRNHDAETTHHRR